MILFFASTAIIALSVAAMAIGSICGRAPLGHCGRSAAECTACTRTCGRRGHGKDGG